MKTVEINFKKIEVADYYPQLNQIKIHIHFSDGTDKALEKQIEIKEPAKQVQEWLAEIRIKIKQRHQEKTLDDHPLAGTVVLNFKQDVDVLEEKMARFLLQVKERTCNSSGCLKIAFLQRATRA